MSKRKKCCKYCSNCLFIQERKSYGCSLWQEDVKPMHVCNDYTDDSDYEDFEMIQIED